MPENKNQKANKIKKKSKLNIKISGLDVDKAEYQQIVTSQSNFSDRNFFKRDY